MTPENWRFSSAADETSMEGIAITHDAYAAISAALPQGVDARPAEPAAKNVFVWLDRSLADCLAALRRPGLLQAAKFRFFRPSGSALPRL